MYLNERIVMSSRRQVARICILHAQRHRLPSMTPQLSGTEAAGGWCRSPGAKRRRFSGSVIGSFVPSFPDFTSQELHMHLSPCVLSSITSYIYAKRPFKNTSHRLRPFGENLLLQGHRLLPSFHDEVQTALRDTMHTGSR